MRDNSIVGISAVWDGCRFDLVEKPIRPAHRTIVRTIACGFCGTDRHALTRPDSVGVSAGHEMIGEIIHLGNNHRVLGGRPVRVGDRVVIVPGKSCGECYHCLTRTAQANLCSHRSVHGWSRFSAHHFYPAGGFSSAIELMDDAWLLPVPSDVTDDIATLAEPLAIAIRCVDRAIAGARPERDLGSALAMRAAVVGLGSIGSLVAYVLRGFGAQVVGFDISDAKCRAFTHRLGFRAARVVPDIATTHAEAIAGLQDLDDFDVVFECAGVIPAFVNALQIVRRGGRVVELGNYVQDDTAPIDPAWICRKEIEIFGSVYANPFTYERVFPVVHRFGEEGLAGVITRKISLVGINEVTTQHDNDLKIVVTMAAQQ